MRISFSSRLHDRRGAAAAFLLAVCALIAVGATMQDRSLTIADFEGATIETRSSLTMMPYADEQFGGTSDARMSLIHPGANGSRGALRIVFRVTAEFANPFAGAWAMVGAEGLATDLSAYRGVRFYARSKERSAFAAGIVRFPGVQKRYTMPFEAQPDWSLIELPFDKFREMTPGSAPPANASPFDAKDITSIGVIVMTGLRGEFELDLDGVELYR